MGGGGRPCAVPCCPAAPCHPPPGFSESRKVGNKKGEAVLTVLIRAEQNLSSSDSESYSTSVWKLVGWGHEHVTVCLSHLLPQIESHKTWKPDAGAHVGWCADQPQRYTLHRDDQAWGTRLVQCATCRAVHSCPTVINLFRMRAKTHEH